MKIFLNNKLYISMKDIAYVLQHETDISDPIKKEIIKANNNQAGLLVDENNKDDFMVLSSDEAKDYFRKTDYILNYGSYAKYDIEYLEKLLAVSSEHRIDLMNQFLGFDEMDKIAHLGLRKQIDDMNIFLASLYDLIEIKKNNSRIMLPKRERKDPNEKYKEFLIKMMQPIKYY